MTTAREREKLEAIGYVVRETTVMTSIDRIFVAMRNGIAFHSGAEFSCVNACKSDTQSPDGMKSTMADKVRWLNDNEGQVELFGWTGTADEGRGYGAAFHESDHPAVLARWGGKQPRFYANSPEAAVDEMFWAVP